MKTSFFPVMTVILLSAFVVVSAGATEVVLRDGVLIAEGLNDEYGLGAFNIVLVYGSDVSFEMGEWIQPYSGAINIQNQDGITRIGGLTTSSEAPTGDVSLIRLGVNGSGAVAIYVNEFYNAMGDPIKTVNPPYGVDAAEPVPGDVTPTPITTVVTQRPETTPESDETPVSQIESPTSAEQGEIPIVTEGPIQTSKAQGIGTVATQTSEVSPASTTEPPKSPLNSTLFIYALLISFVVFQRIYMKKD